MQPTGVPLIACVRREDASDLDDGMTHLVRRVLGPNWEHQEQIRTVRTFLRTNQELSRKV